MIRAALIALAALVLGADPALAHRLKVFATAEGAVVSVRAYFAGGAQARNVMVTVAGPDGRTAHQGRTDAEGRFSFQATRRMDHLIVAEGADGHRAEHRLPARELPETLPAGPSAADDAAPAPPNAAALDTVHLEEMAQLEQMIERSVARQIQPLREQLDAFQNEARWADVLGGIGYIVGLGGLAYGVAMRRGGAS